MTARGNEKLWAGRFQGKVHPAVESFTASIFFDRRLYAYDIQGSMAHCKMLERIGILTAAESRKITKGLKDIQVDIERGRVRFTSEDEDIHMAVERLLTLKIGKTGKKLHTGRSRNDQVVLDLRLYLRDASRRILSALDLLQRALVDRAEKELGVLMPGYTHLQRAQPVLFSHHLLAYYEMFDRDRERTAGALQRIDTMPLGSGALAGSTIPIDREYVADLLHFPKVTQNSLDGVSDRDFCLEFLSAMALMMMHFSRFSEELVLWSSQEFGFIELPDSFCTGSSMMPQKKNPDVPELVRGKTGRVYGHLMAALTVMKGLPLTYNRDMQEDKEPLFDTVDTVESTLELFQRLVREFNIHYDRLTVAVEDEYLLATDLAEYLANQGVPFREAHDAVGGLVKSCLKARRPFSSLKPAEFQKFSKAFKEDVYDILDPKRSVQAKQATGQTSPRKVKERIHDIRKKWKNKGRDS